MKWLILAGFLVVCLPTYSEGGALRCTPGTQDPSCSTERKEILSTVQISKEESVKETTSVDAECLVGTEWESNCHYCRCSDSGVAECLKQDTCDKGVFVEPIKCKPNTRFQRDCNTCVCLENGFGLCTLKLCRSLPKHNMRCAPGTSWKNACNTCWCNPNGSSMCTAIGCLTDDEKHMICAPDSVWKDDCNTCRCTADGLPMCTKINCVSINDFEIESTDKSKEADVPKAKKFEENVIHSVLKRSVCKPSQEFQSDCNSCKCAANGQRYTCSHKECMEGDTDKEVEVFMENEGEDHIERHSVCKPRNTFYIGCNTCHCNIYGTDYSCTNKPCPLPADVELFHELKTTKSSNNTKSVVCVANRMFIKDCNTCWCNDDGTSYFCTRKVCVTELPDDVNSEDQNPEQKLRVIKKDCRPDEVFEVDCNMCRCNSDGKSFSCTRRACVEIDEKNVTLSRKVRAFPQEPAKTCQPGTEFRMDCNKCLCDNEGQDFSCTRIDCNALNNNHASALTKREISEKVPTKCVPGSVFDQGCNVCRCTQDGNFATCSMKRCPQENDVDADVQTDSDPGFRCNPGEQFKRDCNDCTCSADGKSVFCALRLCDQSLTPDNI